MDLQTILVYITLAVAVGYLVRKFFWPKRRQSAAKECGKNDCGCH
ncbi:FeoB-associated Cys-rich membrane protein [Zhouia spongiae]|uniref:FeoB-associated Cys-rich membrane protein n=1 Tax=Zhouia spongiae TaxID=2202721 RepID=A0ABY3YQF0_9FLAO|nr:FeoB-associated Cys-rich membrane protein [Zhouia spongiae]UNZ00052.1 FeoB-associated Cys-rich membrane protein [Zhouia spongiae]